MSESQSTSAASQQEERPFVSVLVPRQLVHLIKHTAKNGMTYDMFTLTLPINTWIDGLDVSGYQCRLFANRYNTEQYQSQQALITMSMRRDDVIHLRALDAQGKVIDSISVDNIYQFVHVLKEKRQLFEDYGMSALVPQQSVQAQPASPHHPPQPISR